MVGRFKSGELLRVDESGNVVGRIQPHGIQRISDQSGFSDAPVGNGATVAPGAFGASIDPVEPAVAWRTLPMADGGVLMLHQYALASTIKIKHPTTDAPSADPGGDSSEYGAPPGGCGGL